MSNPFVGEIRLFGGNFAPAGWAICNGSLLAISEFETLFNLIGTTYGGDGESTFSLPDLRGRVPVHQGQGPGLSPYTIGESGGAETVTLTSGQMPAHTHPLRAASSPASAAVGPTGVLAATSVNAYGSGVPNMAMNAGAVVAAGGSAPHENMAPFLGVNYIISLFGIFPSQS